MHVCILTTAHPTDDVRVHEKVGQSFVQRGYKVSWVGPEISFSGKPPAPADGYELHLFPIGSGKLDRLLRYRPARKLAEQIEDVDWYYCPDPDSASLAVELARSRKTKVMFDIHEIYHGRAVSHWSFGLKQVNVLANYFIKRKIERTCSRCDLVLAVSQVVLDAYAKEHSNRLVLRSCPPRWFHAPRKARSRENGFVLMHGKANFGRGTKPLLDALPSLKNLTPPVKVICFEQFQPGVDGVDKAGFQKIIRGMGIEEMIDLRPPVKLREMPGILSECDAGLLLYQPGLAEASLPNRLFEYMAAGLPIIAPTYSTQIKALLDQEQCGLTVESDNPGSIAEGIAKLHKNRDLSERMGRNAEEAFLKRHNWEAEAQQLFKLMES